jgi:hypothetical protein
MQARVVGTGLAGADSFEQLAAHVPFEQNGALDGHDFGDDQSRQPSEPISHVTVASPEFAQTVSPAVQLVVHVFVFAVSAIATSVETPAFGVTIAAP